MTIRNLKFDEKTFFFIALVLILILRIRLADVAMERDEGEYAYAGWQILRGGLPYLDFYNMKFPGVYYCYALIFKIFGVSMVAVRLSVLVLNLFSTFFIFKIAERWMGQSGAWVSAGAFLLLSGSFEAQGIISNTEHFVVFFYLLGLFLLLKEAILLSGLSLGLACLMKQHAVFFAVFVGFYLVKDFFSSENKGKILKNALILITGFTIPFLILVAFVKANNIFEPFYFFTIDYAAAYSGINQPTFKHISVYKYMAVENLGIWLAFWIVFFSVLKNILFYKKHGDGTLKINTLRMIFLFFLFSFVAICPGWYFRPHYFQLLFPASALLMGYGFTQMHWHIRFKNWKITSAHFLILSLCLSILGQSGYYFWKSPEKVLNDMYQGGEYFTSFRKIGEYLGETTNTADEIGFYGSDPQILFYAKRKNASGYLYAFPLVESHRFAEQMTEQYIHEIEAKKPKWFLFSTVSQGLENEKTTQRINNWFQDYIKTNYFINGVFYETGEKDGKGEFLKNETKADTSKKALLYIYQRN